MLQSKDIDRLNGYKTRPIHMLPTRDTLQIQRHTETESDSVENVFHANVNQKKLEYQYLYQIE